MPALYDRYNYPLFWKGREYEHESEVLAIQSFLNKIPHINRLIDIGAGYGRLTPYYLYRAKRSVLIDSSAKMLKMAKDKISVIGGNRVSNVKYIQTGTNKLSKKVKNGTFDVVLCVRVLHLTDNVSGALLMIRKLLSKNGYVILEFPNKLHGKALARHLAKGDIKYSKNTTAIDRRQQMNCTLPYMNFHPTEIQKELINNGFRIIEKRSVSNIRSSFLKKHLPLNVILVLESMLQRPLSYLNFGPSIFILAKKRGY